MTSTDKGTSGPSFSQALATVVASFISKKWQMDGMTFAAVNTLIILTTTSIFGDWWIWLKEQWVVAGFSWAMAGKLSGTMVGLCVLAGAIYLYRHTFYNVYYWLYGYKFKNSTISGDYMTKQYFEYMKLFKSFYRIQTFNIENSMICYDRITESIAFNDTNYGVRGELSFTHKKRKSDTHNNSTPTKTPPTTATTTATPTTTTAATTGTTTTATPAATVATPVTAPINNNDMNPEDYELIINLVNCVCYKTNICSGLDKYVDKIMAYDTTKHTNDCDLQITIGGTKFVIFKKYINSHRVFYTTNNILITDTDTKNPNIFFPAKNVTKFNDKLFGVTGFVSWTTENDGIVIFAKCKFSGIGNDEYKKIGEFDDVDRNVTNIDEYIGGVSKVVSNMDESGEKLVQYSVDKTKGQDSVTVMRENQIITPQQLEERFIHTLFHPETEKLWNLIKNINYHPEKVWATGQAPRISLLLYGPPGTGKSTFAYRIAMATKRHLLNIKVSKYKKSELTDLFARPKIKSTHYSPKDVVYVLDEFDQDIDKLLLRQSCQTKQIESIKTVIDDMIKPEHHTSVQIAQMPIIQQAQQPTSQKMADVEKTLGEADEKVKKLEGFVEGVTKTYDKISGMGDDIVTLHELLTIFQGATPIDGCIIIATTNKYEELSDKCPALFRAGRLTPICFPNFDGEMINRVSQHYFNRKLEFDVSDVSLQPSKVVELSTESIMQPSCHFEHFSHEIANLIKTTQQKQ